MIDVSVCVIIMDEFFFKNRFLYFCVIYPWVHAFVSVTCVTCSLQLNVDGICHEWQNDVTVTLWSNMCCVFVLKCWP